MRSKNLHGIQPSSLSHRISSNLRSSMCTPSSDDLRAWEEIRDVSMRSGLSHAPHTYSIFTESEEKTQCSCSINSFRLFTGLVYFCSSGFSSPKNDFVSSRTASFLFSSSISIDILCVWRSGILDFTIGQVGDSQTLFFPQRCYQLALSLYNVSWAQIWNLLSFCCLFRWSVSQYFTDETLGRDWTIFAVFKLLLNTRAGFELITIMFELFLLLLSLSRLL